jgi:hypothetical protein
MPTIGGELENRHAAVWRRAPVPKDFGERASSAPIDGRLQLPLHIWWSGHGPISVDMSDPADRRFVYEQVLANGTANDVETLIHPAQLVADWDELFLPAAVAEIWVPWFDAHPELCL